ncbi:MAG: hypothetical protein NTX03_07005 [Bacteroidetes bacterium]|nr:hypothetical protein [Bacteroidota bacterium]
MLVFDMMNGTEIDMSTYSFQSKFVALPEVKAERHIELNEAEIIAKRDLSLLKAKATEDLKK